MSLWASIVRQVLRTHRAFTATILNTNGQVLLKMKRPFQFINSKLYVMDEHENVLGQVHQRWHLLRRRYELFVETDEG